MHLSKRHSIAPFHLDLLFPIPPFLHVNIAYSKLSTIIISSIATGGPSSLEIPISHIFSYIKGGGGGGENPCDIKIFQKSRTYLIHKAVRLLGSQVLVMTSHCQDCLSRPSEVIYEIWSVTQRILLNYIYKQTIAWRCLFIRFGSFDMCKVGWDVSLAL